MSAVLDTIRRERAQLLMRDRAAQARILFLWRRLQAIIERDAADLERRLLTLVDAGEPVRPGMLHTAGRLDELRAQVREVVDAYSRGVIPLVDREVLHALEHGQRSAITAMTAAGVPHGELIGQALRVRPVERLAAISAPGQPVGGVLASMGGELASLLEDELLRGVAEGLNPREVARRMVRVGDVARRRALTVARTESLRAFRGAMTDTMAATDGVDGWIWVATRDSRTCAACLLMHGTVHADGEPMAAHPNCRCVQAPNVEGIYDEVIPRTGVQIVRAMTPGEQDRLLGPVKGRLLRSRQIAAQDLVATRSSPVWGDNVQPASIAAARRNAALRRAGRRAA